MLDSFDNTNSIRVPSAAEMVEKGMESAAFNAKLLEKIEELTLYVVELEKRLKSLEKK